MNAVVERVRKPEYTGDRRCWPCTSVNAALLVAVVVAVWIVSQPAAVALAIVGGAAIWLRGYLVPYTPQFAPRLVAALPWMDGFHEEPVEATTLAADGEIDGETVAEALLDAGVLVAGPEGESLELDESFRDRWRAEIAELRERDDEALADATLAVAPGAVAAEPRDQSDRTWIVLDDGSGRLAGETWLTRTVAIAEAGAVGALADAIPSGEDALFAAAARPLRTFLQQCPVCDGEVVESTTNACCGGAPNPMASPVQDVLVCGDCGQRVYTFEREVYEPGE